MVNGSIHLNVGLVWLAEGSPGQEARTNSLAHKGKKICPSGARVGKVVLLAYMEDFCQCRVQLVLLLVMP